MRDMALPAVQRDALVAPMRRVIAGYNVSQDERWTGTTNWQKADRFARAALAAIEEQYVLIPRDQVTVERKISGPAAPLWIGKGVGPSGRTCVSRLVTPWREVSE